MPCSPHRSPPWRKRGSTGTRTQDCDLYARPSQRDSARSIITTTPSLATPAEGLSGKFTKKDRKEFGIIPGVTDRDYYTNSNHVPVYYKCTALKKAQIEAPYHDLTRGGHIFYVEIDGDATHNPSVISSVVDMMDKYNMGYGSVNHNRNRCLDCWIRECGCQPGSMS